MKALIAFINWALWMALPFIVIAISVILFGFTFKYTDVVTSKGFAFLYSFYFIIGTILWLIVVDVPNFIKTPK